MKKVQKTTASGIASALCTAVMLLTTVIPFFMYISPIFSGIIILIVSYMCGNRWAWASFAIVSILSLLLLTDKETALIFITFFGYYPLVKSAFEKQGRALRIALKALLLNLSFVISSLLAVLLFSASFSEYQELGGWIIPIYIVLGNVLFVMYDKALTKYKQTFTTLSLKLSKLSRL